MVKTVRAYLIGVAGLRHLLTSLNAILFPHMLDFAAIPIVKLLPLWAWISLDTIIGFANLLAGLIGHHRLGRVSLIISSAATFTVGFGIFIGTTYAGLRPDIHIIGIYPQISIFLIGLAGADYVMLCQPWRQPHLPPLPSLHLPPRDAP